MSYNPTWDRILADDEKIEYEFSIGWRYRLFGLIVFSLVSFGLIVWGVATAGATTELDTPRAMLGFVTAGMGAALFLFGLFYFLYYLKVANLYAFTNRRVLVGRGGLSTELTGVDYEDITDITVVEPLFEKIFTSTGYIMVNTAGTEQQEIILVAIEDPYGVRKKLDEIRDRSVSHRVVVH